MLKRLAHRLGSNRVTRRVGTKIRQEAHDLLHGGPPTDDLLRPVGPDVPSDAQVQQVLDLCMRIGEVLLASGQPAAETSETMVRIASALGLPTVDVDITFNSVSMCCHRGMVAPPVTTMRMINNRTTDLTRLTAVARIVRWVETGKLGVHGAAAALAEAVTAPHPYPRWVATLGWAGQSAAVALLLGGPPSSALAAFLITAYLDRLGRKLGRWGLAPFFQQMAGGLVATISTVALFALGFLSSTNPSIAIAAAMTVLLSGLSVVGSVQDAVSANYVTAAGRGVEITLLTAGLLTGVVLGLKVGITFGITLNPAEPLAANLARFLMSTFAAATVSGMFALASYAPRRALLAAGLAGGVGWATYGILTLAANMGPVVATGIAATVVGIATGLFRRGGGVHPHVITLSGIIPLLPGLTIYRGFYQLSVEGVSDGLVTITLALAIGLAIAAGVALGDFIAQPRQPGVVAPPV